MFYNVERCEKKCYMYKKNKKTKLTNNCWKRGYIEMKRVRLPVILNCINVLCVISSLVLSGYAIHSANKLAIYQVEQERLPSVVCLKQEIKADFETDYYDISFSFSILDDRNNLYLVKGDSPISILHFPKLKLYVYASTDEILYKALIDSSLFLALKKGEYEEVSISEGDILKICYDGTLTRNKFKYSYH